MYCMPHLGPAPQTSLGLQDRKMVINHSTLGICRWGSCTQSFASSYVVEGVGESKSETPRDTSSRKFILNFLFVLWFFYQGKLWLPNENNLTSSWGLGPRKCKLDPVDVRNQPPCLPATEAWVQGASKEPRSQAQPQRRLWSSCWPSRTVVVKNMDVHGGGNQVYDFLCS
jgi:hypothetical protein